MVQGRGAQWPLHGVSQDCVWGDFYFGWEKEMAAHSSILAWKIPMGRGACWAMIHGVTKSQTQVKGFSTTLGRRLF